MRTYSPTIATQRVLVLAMPLTAAAWLVSVPGVLTTSSFLAVAGVLIGGFWVARATYRNGQPAASLPQVLHDAEHAASSEARRDDR